MLTLLVMAALLRVSYEMARPGQPISRQQNDLLADTIANGGVDPNNHVLQPWQKEASEKAVRKYAEAQPKKWRRWNEAMFEPARRPAK